MSDLEIHCPHCELLFDVPRSMKGGIANCPDCGRTVPIESGPEPLYWMLVALAVGAVVCISGLIALANPVAGGALLVVGLLLVAITAMAM